MKRIIYLMAILFVPALTVSCEKELMDYEGVEGVYFAVQWGSSWGGESTWPFMPYSNVEFIKIAGDKTTINLKVMATGELKPYDRVFNVTINPDSTDCVVGTDFLEPPAQVTIAANEYFAYVPLVINRTQKMQDATKKIGLRLVPNKDFALAFPDWDAVPGFATGTVIEKFDASYHTIYVNDFVVQPAVWIGSINPEGAETGLWGAFSRKKLELFCELFNLTYASFANTTLMPTGLQSLITEVASRHLIEQYEKGTPILEDDGRLMYVGQCPWISKPGVPWVPEP